MALSNMRTDVAVRGANSSRSMAAVASNGLRTRRAKLIDPSKQAPNGGRGCSPQGLVAAMVSQYCKLLSRLMRSIKITPGSAKLYVARMIWSHRSRACITLYEAPSNVSSHGPSSRTAAMKASVTRTDKLNMRRRPGSCLAAMNASISGWSHRSPAIIAPRRCPADMIVRHMASHTSMKDSGPDASAPTPLTSAPLGRSVEKS